MTGSLANFERLQSRLQQQVDRADRGQLMPKTAVALGFPAPAERLDALVGALSSERVIVPVPVEPHPSAGDCHQLRDFSPQVGAPLQVAESPAGPAVVAFSSAQELAEWQPEARPMVLGTQKCALTAIGCGTPLLWVDPAGASIVIPRAAVEALAAAGPWLPAWENPHLQEELTEVARSAAQQWGGQAIVRVVPATHEAGQVTVRVDVGLTGSPEMSQVRLLLAELARLPSLGAAADHVEFVPRLLQVA